MSEVISVRLSHNNPREAKALNVLTGLRSEGRSTRYIITEALLSFESNQKYENKSGVLIEVNEKLSRISQTIEHLRSGNLQLPLDSESIVSSTPLSESFVASIVKNIEPGIKFEK